MNMENPLVGCDVRDERYNVRVFAIWIGEDTGRGCCREAAAK